MKARPVIVIGCPCFGTVAPDLLQDWMRWMYHLGRRMPQYDFELAIVPKSEQFRARNNIVKAARSIDADYVLMIDDDMIIDPWDTSHPTDAYDFIDALVKHDQDICGVLYYQRTGGCHPVVMAATDTVGYRFLRDDEITHRLQPVAVAGGGCFLVKMRVFDKIAEPYFEPEHVYGTDVQLCRKAAALGLSVAVDTGIELGHVREERTIVTSRNRGELAMSGNVQGETKRFIADMVYGDLIADATAYTGRDLATMTAEAHAFMQQRRTSGLSDAEWYRQFPKERIGRQVWFNTQTRGKRTMTEFILAAIDHSRTSTVLDFGCGIGIPAFFLAQKGHRVTAVDREGTGTLDFLQWRAQHHDVALTIAPTTTDIPDLGDAEFDVIIAMDVLEHIAPWEEVLEQLAAHLKPGGVFFCNNGILDDQTHPEHYLMDTGTFVAACARVGLMPLNEIAFHKRGVPAAAARSAAKEFQRA